jgi:hypothetical protein
MLDILFWSAKWTLQANRVTDKLTYVHDRVYCCRSGSAADTQAVADFVHYYMQMFACVIILRTFTKGSWLLSLTDKRLVHLHQYTQLLHCLKNFVMRTKML